MKNLEQGLNKLSWSLFRLWAVVVVIGAIFSAIGRCSTSQSVSKQAREMAKAGVTTPKNLALLDGEKLTNEMISEYEEAVTALKERCREPHHELTYMAHLMSKRYRYVGKDVNNYEAMRRFRTMAKSSDRTPPINCTSIYSYFMNAPDKEIRQRF